MSRSQADGTREKGPPSPGGACGEALGGTTSEGQVQSPGEAQASTAGRSLRLPGGSTSPLPSAVCRGSSQWLPTQLPLNKGGGAWERPTAPRSAHPGATSWEREAGLLGSQQLRGLFQVWPAPAPQLGHPCGHPQRAPPPLSPRPPLMAVQPGWELAGGALSGRLGSPHISTCNRGGEDRPAPLAPAAPASLTARLRHGPRARDGGGTPHPRGLRAARGPRSRPFQTHVPRASWATCSRSSRQGPLCATESFPAPAHGAPCTSSLSAQPVASSSAVHPQLCTHSSLPRGAAGFPPVL